MAQQAQFVACSSAASCLLREVGTGLLHTLQLPTSKLVARYIVETPRRYPASAVANPKLYFATVGGTLRKLPTPRAGKARQLCSLGGPWGILFRGAPPPTLMPKTGPTPSHRVRQQHSRRIKRSEGYWLCSQSSPTGPFSMVDHHGEECSDGRFLSFCGFRVL